MSLCALHLLCCFSTFLTLNELARDMVTVLPDGLCEERGRDLLILK